MTPLPLHIAPLGQSEEVPFELLELADPSRSEIEQYLQTGTCHLASLETEIVGAVVLEPIESTTIEIKNIAVKPSEQGKGIGKTLLRYAERWSRDLGIEKMIIRTGNSSLGPLALYQKEGFVIHNIEKDYFVKHYETPIYENGIQCKDQITLIKSLER